MRQLIITLTTLFFVLIYQNSKAQHVWQTNPKECKVLQDTMGAKLLLITLDPGDSLAPHTHPPYMIYFIQGGALTEYIEHGKTIHASIASGLSAQHSGQPVHSDKNSGSSTIRFMMVEFTDQKIK